MDPSGRRPRTFGRDPSRPLAVFFSLCAATSGCATTGTVLEASATQRLHRDRAWWTGETETVREAATPTTPPDVTPAKFPRTLAANDRTSCAIRDGEVYCWGDHSPTPRRLPGLQTTIEIALGRGHGCALQSDGTVSCWQGRPGQRTLEQIGGVTEAIRIAAGAYHACALMRTGSIKCWGQNGDGQLGVNPEPKEIQRGIQVVGMETPQRSFQVVGIERAIAIAARDSRSCAILEGGQPVCWGRSQQGVPNPTQARRRIRSSYVPMPIARIDQAMELELSWDGGCAVGAEGSVRCWGETRSMTRIESVSGMQDVQSVSGHLYRNLRPSPQQSRAGCVLRRNGEVFCLRSLLVERYPGGRNAEVWTPVPLPQPAVELAAGADHHCARLDDGDVMCWGTASDGRLGPIQHVFRATAIDGLADVEETVSGDDFACARRRNGEIVCWGDRFSCYASDTAIATAGTAIREEAGLPTPQVTSPPLMSLPALGPAEALVLANEDLCTRQQDGRFTCLDVKAIPQTPGPCEPLGELVRTIPGLQGAVDVALSFHAFVGLMGNGTVIWVPDPRRAIRGENEVLATTQVLTRVPGALEIATPYHQTNGGQPVCLRTRNGRVHCFAWLGTIPNTNIRARPIPNLRRVRHLMGSFTGQMAVITSDHARATLNWSRRNAAPRSSPRPRNRSRGAGSAQTHEFTVGVPQPGILTEANGCSLHPKGLVRCTRGPHFAPQAPANAPPPTLRRGTAGQGILPLRNVRRLSVGRNHACAVDDSWQVHCWGRNLYGVLGGAPSTGDAGPVAVPGFSRVSTAGAAP